MATILVNDICQVQQENNKENQHHVNNKDHSQQQQQQQQPTIILSPPPTSRPRKRSFRGLFKQQQQQQQQQPTTPPSSILGRRLSNLSLRSNQSSTSPGSSRPPSPSSSETVGAAAVAASLAAALAVGQRDDSTSNVDQRLHPNAAYHKPTTDYFPPSPSSSVSSPRSSESPSTTATTMFGEMKRALSQYQHIRHLSIRRRKSSATLNNDNNNNNEEEQDEQQPKQPNQLKQPEKLHEKYSGYRKGKVIGSGATAVIKLLDINKGTDQHTVIAVKRFRKRDRDETEREYNKRMTNEFCISKVLRHPHIVETFDLVQDHKNRWCSVMEYVRFNFHKLTFLPVSSFFFSFLSLT